MEALQEAVECLRPFVETMGWDYVVVWKLGDDPSQFFEWVGCCCSACGNAKQKRTTKMMNPSNTPCRDGYFLHPVKTLACQALSEFPTSMPLYSGIHGDVAITNQIKWLWISPGTSSSDSEPSYKSAGTRVLIPVIGGVVELFSSKHVTTLIPEERKIVDIMMSQCEFFWKQETEALGSCTYMDLREQIFSNCLRKCSVTSIPKCIRLTTEVSPNFVSCAYQNFEGSSSISNPSSERTSLASCSEYAVQGGTLKQFSRESLVIDHAKSLFSSDVVSVKLENTTIRDSDEEHGYRSKHLYAERSRRKRIKNKLLALRAIVPNISKMDKAAILGDALEYIEELKGKEKTLQDELHQMEKDNPKVMETDLKLPVLHETHQFKDLLHHHDAADSIVSSTLSLNQQVQVEVNPMSEREVLIRILFRQKRRWFSSLMETLLSSSLTIIDANITTLDGNTLAVLVAEGLDTDTCIQKLRDLLMNVVS